MTSDEHKELIGWISMHVRDEIARALKSCDAAIADAIGKVLAEERAKFREAHAALVARVASIEQRALDTAPVLDLRAERDRRRSGAA